MTVSPAYLTSVSPPPIQWCLPSLSSGHVPTRPDCLKILLLPPFQGISRPNVGKPLPFAFNIDKPADRLLSAVVYMSGWINLCGQNSSISTSVNSTCLASQNPVKEALASSLDISDLRSLFCTCATTW